MYLVVLKPRGIRVSGLYSLPVSFVFSESAPHLCKYRLCGRANFFALVTVLNLN